MPIYEYLCDKCGRKNEVIMGIDTDDSGIRCIYCNSIRLKKILSTPARTPQYSSCPSDHTCCGSQERCHDAPCDTGGEQCHSHHKK